MDEDRFFFDVIVENSSQLGFDFSYQVQGGGRVGPVRILAGQSGPLPIFSDREASEVEFFAKVGANEEESVTCHYDGEEQKTPCSV
jgi:hypothetical protein